jgi:hypothetical protein
MAAWIFSKGFVDVRLEFGDGMCDLAGKYWDE